MHRVLVIVQNLPVPLDRRVWLECQVLRDAGYRVSVICPRGPGDPAVQMLDGIALYKYPPAPPTSGTASYLYEFVYSWLATAALSVRVRRSRGFDVVQACNPPDTYWALALLWRRRGVRFVFDQHDLNPELFRSRFGEPRGALARLQLGVLRWLERRSYRAADHVVTVNESYKQVAMTRGGLTDGDISVVRSGPDTRRMRPLRHPSVWDRRASHLLVYLGIMGPQDGVDVMLEALAVLVHDLGRRDVHVAVLGFGDCLEDLERRSEELGLSPYVTFTGRVDGRLIGEYLSSARIGLSPDPKNPLNDVSTMNKTMEYMAYALPVVAFDLRETRVSAGEAAVYVAPGDVRGYAEAIARLLDDPRRRVEMARCARHRAVTELDWEPQARRYRAVYDRLFGRGQPDGSGGPALHDRRTAERAPVDAWGAPLVDLRDAEAFEHFLLTREGRAVAEDLVPRASSHAGAAAPVPATAPVLQVGG